MKIKRNLAILAGTLIVFGGGAGLAVAGPLNPPPDNPGSPGDICSRGNSGQDCRPDPSPNGQDCLDHGNYGRGNEDHCDTTTTPTETTPTETTPTTTTPTTPTGTTPTETVPTTTTPTTTTPIVTVPPVVTTPTPAAKPPAKKPVALPTRKSLEKGLARQSKGVDVNAPGHVQASQELPYTGLSLWFWFALGGTLVATGILLRELPRVRRWTA